MKLKIIPIFFYLLISFFMVFLTNASEINNTSDITPMIIGSKNAPVKIIEYASFTCPHCATFHNEVLPKLKNDYINSGKVLLEYREVYFDGPGLWAGLLARCQGNKKYFAMVDLIYKKQKDWASGNRNDIIEGLLSIGRQTGLDDKKSRKCMENSEQAKKLIDRFKKNITEDGISSTPSFVINDKLMSNMTYDKMKNIIESLLK